MDADTRMACSLVLSLLVSAGNLRAAAAGDADILHVGLRYVLAFVLAFVAVGYVGRLLRDDADAAEARRAAIGDADDGPEPIEGLRLADE